MSTTPEPDRPTGKRDQKHKPDAAPAARENTGSEEGSDVSVEDAVQALQEQRNTPPPRTGHEEP